VSLFTKSATLRSIANDLSQNPKLASAGLLPVSQAKTGDDWAQTRLEVKESKAKYIEKQSKTGTFGALFWAVAIVPNLYTIKRELQK
jgi:hypothetical protein